MKKLIELDTTLDALREVIVPAEDIGFGDESTDGYNDGINMAVTVVSGVPTVDAVTVVRCKDCKHYRPYAGIADGYCHMAEWYKRYQYENDFCSRGERKDGEHETD